MRRILLLVQKDLLRRARQPLGIVLMILFPLLLAGMMAIAFGTGDGEAPRAHLLVDNRDDGLAGKAIDAMLQADQVAVLVRAESVEQGTGEARIESGEASALLIVPEGTTDKLLQGEAVTFVLLRNPAQGLLPEIAEQICAVLAEGLDLVAQLLQGELERLGLESLDDLEDLSDAELIAMTLAIRDSFKGLDEFVVDGGLPLGLEVIDLGEVAEVEAASKDDTKDDTKDDDSMLGQIFLLVLPGLAIYALFLIGDQMMRDLLVEQEAGTLRRQLLMPIHARHLIAAKILISLLVGLLALAVLTLVMVVFLDARLDPLGLLLLALTVVLCSTGFATVIYGVAKNEHQGSAAAGLLYLVLAFASGSFIPLSNLPQIARAVAPYTPLYWGGQGLRDLLDGAGLLEIAPMILLLGGLGTGLALIGSWLLERRLVGGSVR